jgi:GNAT superfamily N-acetyltransferase
MCNKDAQAKVEIEIRALADDEMNALYDLRAVVLRPGQPRAGSHYSGDDAPDTIHLGAFYAGRCVGSASLYRENGLRLRGMAVEAELRGYGIGAALIREAQRIARQQRRELWCNARDSAAGFYEKLGWVVEGEGFEVAGTGPHHVMRWQP